MRRQHAMHPPHRPADATLVRHGAGEMYWQAADGLVVRIAAGDDRAYRASADSGAIEACAPEGGVIHVSPRTVAMPSTRPRVGAVGLAMALWLRWFADTA